MLLTFKSHFTFICQMFPADLMHQMMLKLCCFIWLLIVSSFKHLIKLLMGRWNMVNDQEERIIRTSSESNYSIFDQFGEEEKPEFAFGFRFDQIKEEDLIGYRGNPEVKLEKTQDVFMNTSKYQVLSVQDVGGFFIEPESASFTVHEMFVEPPSVEDDDLIIQKRKKNRIIHDLERVEVDDDKMVSSQVNIIEEQKELKESFNVSLNEKVDGFMGSEVSLDQVLQRVDASAKVSIIIEEKTDESVADASSCEDIQDLPVKSELILGKNGLLKSEEINNWLGEFFMRNDNFGYEYDSLDHHQLESDDSGDGSLSVSLQEVDSVIEQESKSCCSPSVQEEINDDRVEQEPNLENEQHNYESDDEDGSDFCFENALEPGNEPMKGTEYEEESYVQSWDYDSEDDDDEEDDMDFWLEHQELIGQMKMELKNTRTGGLPTILEEVETPRMKEDYKPLKINEKLEHRDQMAEIQKFYRSYMEKMRKLDVLNYQTLQAINFLRMKHPEQLNTGENASLSAIKSVVFPSLWPCKLRRIYADPTLKSITELHKDLEIVYVGQACLSWEILHWQYKKSERITTLRSSRIPIL